jgi:hypothetical protein
MAITTLLGGIRRNDNRFTTVVPISVLTELTIPGMAFEAKKVTAENYDHLDERVQLCGATHRSWHSAALWTEELTKT